MLPRARPDLKALRILFVSVARSAIGFGHLNRCLSLAIFAQKCGADVRFLVFGNLAAQLQVNAASFSCILLDESAITSEDLSRVKQGQVDVVIIDILFPGWSTFKPSLVFQSLRCLGCLLVVIDVLGNDSIVSLIPDLDADIIISPYVSHTLDFPKQRWRYIKGAEYALLGSEYANLPPRRQRLFANRVMVSCGGSDPRGHTIVVLRGLENVEQHLEIRVVVGPLFSRELYMEIESLAAFSRHKITLVVAPRTLLNEMLRCDLAIGTNGLTKYELAASSTPALLFSINEEFDLINKPFADTQTSVNLGIGVSAEQIEQESSRLLQNFTLRCIMAKKGRMVVDGAGVNRLFIEIKKEYDAKKRVEDC